MMRSHGLFFPRAHFFGRRECRKTRILGLSFGVPQAKELRGHVQAMMTETHGTVRRKELE